MMGPLKLFDGPILIDYENYLKKESGFNNKNFARLFSDLLTYPFELINIEDDPRVRGGATLRVSFMGGGEIDLKSVSVLEVLIALAKRIDTEYIGIPGESHPEIIFTEFLNNLGLLRYTNNNYNELEVQNIILKFVKRTYSYNGVGGIFPLKKSPIDQRTLPLWRQMTMYLSERNN